MYQKLTLKSFFMKLKTTWLLMLIMALSVQFAIAQEKTISGTVTSEGDGLPLPGVNVIVMGTSRGVQTDFDGNYSINASAGEVLQFSFIGMKEAQATVGSNTTINIILQEDVSALDEVVVVAYGTTTKQAFTGSASVIKSEDLELRSLTSPIAAIEGSTTGVQFVAASGQPGSSPSIVIRGVGTLNGTTDPLFIVDGSPYQGGLGALNQDDIESLTVLKDAASMSLYGARAANGVVIITTKTGKKGSGVKVNFTTQYGVITKAINEYPAVSPGEYYELMFQSYKNSLSGSDAAQVAASTIFNRLGRNPFNVPNDQIVGADGVLNPNARVIAEDLDWYGALERVGTRQNHNINVSGGGDNHTVFFSASNLKEDGYVIESDFNRTTSRLNGTFSPTDWLSMGGSIYLANDKTNGPPSRGGSIANVFGFAKGMGSIYSPYLLDPDTGMIIRDEAGKPLWDRGESISSLGIQSRPTNVGRNALEEAILNNEITKQNTYNFRYNADLTIIEGLKFSINYSQEYQDYINQSYENAEVGDGAPTARFQDFRFRRTAETFGQLLNYNKSFGKHNLNITVGHENFHRNYSYNSVFKGTQTAVGIYEADNFSVILDASGSSTDYKIEGFLGRLNYDFDDKYYISGSFRRDGSSVFLNKKWGTFYSVGGSWRISQEDFMKDVSFISNLKLRGSYGEVGNDQLGNYYISQPVYAIFPNAGAPGVYWDTTGNADLQWESSESWDVALDFGVLDNRITGTFEYYKKISSDLLYNVPIPASEGQVEAPDNVGDLFNEGFELSLNARVVDSDNFSWDLGLQASTLKNEITSLPDPFVDGSKRWEVGRSRFDFFLYDYAGVDPSNGDALYYMYEEIDDEVGIPVLNDNGTHATTNDWEDAGKGYVNETAVPDVIGSISNVFRYKNIDLNILLTYQIGGY